MKTAVRILAIAIVLPLFFVACEEGVKVGSSVITDTDIQRRRALPAFEGADSLADDVALAALKREGREERIAEMLDLAPTDSALQVAGASIMTSLREGEVDRLMKIFENDTADFIDHTVRPQLIRAALLRHHSTVIADSSEARRKIHRAIEILRGDAHMEDVAESLQVDYQRDTLRPDAEVTEAVKERFGPEVTSDPTIPLLANLVEGEMLNQVLEDATGYRVIRLVERQGTALVVEWVGADRMGYEEWVEQEG